MALFWMDGLLVATPSTRWQRVIIIIILSPQLFLLIVASVPTILVAPFLPESRHKTVLSILDRYLACIMALAGLDISWQPEHEGSSSASQTAGTPDDRGDQDLTAHAATPVQQAGDFDRTGVLVALWIGIVTCIGVFVAAAVAHGVLRIAGMLFGAIAAVITALWLIQIFMTGPGGPSSR
jgi:hypothetical protein